MGVAGMGGGIFVVLDQQRRERERAAVRRQAADQTQSCERGEHMYVTGKRYCPLCGAEL